MPDQVDVALSTEKLNHIESYDPGDLTISLQAGVSLAHAVAACAEHRQLLPIEAPEGTTIGGALSTSSAGPLRAAFGGLRDFCIGVNFISGDGMNGRGGGRVVKNVAGYDLMKLMIGSHGSLAIITSANFKLFPSPQQTITFVCEFASLGEGLALRDSLLRSPLSPLACEIVSPSAIEYLSESEPHDPDEWAPEPSTQNTAAWQLMIRFAGSDRVLARLRHELAASVSRELSGAGDRPLEPGRHIRRAFAETSPQRDDLSSGAPSSGFAIGHTGRREFCHGLQLRRGDHRTRHCGLFDCCVSSAGHRSSGGNAVRQRGV